jgi:hypothetical protein
MAREGLLPIIAGTAVTAIGAIMRGTDMQKHGMSKKDITPLLGAGLLGFGLAHIVLGTTDIVQHRR